MRKLIENYCARGVQFIRASVYLYCRGFIFDKVGHIKVELVVKVPCLALDQSAQSS